MPDQSIIIPHPLDPHSVAIIQENVARGGSHCSVPVDKTSRYMGERLTVSVDGGSHRSVRGLDGCRYRVDAASCGSEHACPRVEAASLVQLDVVENDNISG